MTLVPPDSGDPELSVVMVTYGAWSLTKRAVAALVANTERPFELIVVDNCSEDETKARLSELRDVRVILNEQNRGFGPATNQGAEHARADHLLLLNTDAFVHRGWLEPLLEALQQPGVGAVVPRYLHTDGSLQDAGTLLAQDGTVLVYGDGDDPDRLCYRFRRVVDFGAAACMLVRRSAFEELGGFDDRYAPAYYEDADLGLRLAQIGLTVVYEPRSVVTHERYGSGGSDGAVALSERHRHLFVERWSSELVGRPWTFQGTSEQAVISARDAPATPRVLICTRSVDPGAEEVAQALLDDWPRARVTWATSPPADGFDPDPRLEIGVEVVDQTDPSWLTSRLFHYDLAVLGERSDVPLLEALARTQPQAHRVSLTELVGPPENLHVRLKNVLVEAGIAPSWPRPLNKPLG
jgi:GT2 family glycosyltransferase